jgi:hypothetical protein
VSQLVRLQRKALEVEGLLLTVDTYDQALEWSSGLPWAELNEATEEMFLAGILILRGGVPALKVPMGHYIIREPDGQDGRWLCASVDSVHRNFEEVK